MRRKKVAELCSVGMLFPTSAAVDLVHVEGREEADLVFNGDGTALSLMRVILEWDVDLAAGDGGQSDSDV